MTNVLRRRAYSRRILFAALLFVLASVLVGVGIVGFRALRPSDRVPVATPFVEQATDTAWVAVADTGVQGTSDLKTVDEKVVIRNGAVITNLHVTGRLTIDADNVTVRNVRIDPDGSAFGVRIAEGTEGTLLENVTVAGAPGCSAAVSGASYVARRLDVSGCHDGFKVAGNSTIERSWVHDLRDAPGSHNDAVQSAGGDQIRIIGNVLEGPFRDSTSALKLDTRLAPFRDLVIRDNLLHGGSFTIYLGAGGDVAASDASSVRVTGNTWISDSWSVGPMSVEETVRIESWDQNVFDSGRPVDLVRSARESD